MFGSQFPEECPLGLSSMTGPTLPPEGCPGYLSVCGHRPFSVSIGVELGYYKCSLTIGLWRDHSLRSGSVCRRSLPSDEQFMNSLMYKNRHYLQQGIPSGIAYIDIFTSIYTVLLIKKSNLQDSPEILLNLYNFGHLSKANSI